jgi:4-hydroxy-3-polyprenylbenzoate decarboxylase
MKPRVVVGVSGASGAAIAVSLVHSLREVGAEIHLVVSRAGERTLGAEVGETALVDLRRSVDAAYRIDDIGAAIASGSFATAGMIVAPCSMRTLSAVAYSLSDNLITRAADVQLKERRPLVLLTRETPLHLGHLRAMMAATEAGAIVAPPVPAFYLKLTRLEDIIDEIARRAIDQLRAFAPMARAWEGEAQRS